MGKNKKVTNNAPKNTNDATIQVAKENAVLYHFIGGQSKNDSNVRVEIKQDKNGYYFVVNDKELPERYAYIGDYRHNQSVVRDKAGVYHYVSFERNGNTPVSRGSYEFASDVKEGSSVVHEIGGKYRIRNAQTGDLSQEEYAWAGDSCCGVRRVKLEKDKGGFRYRFPDGSMSDQFAVAEDFVDNHGLCRKYSSSGWQYINLSKELSQEFTHAQSYKNGFGRVTLNGQKQYVDILDNVSDDETAVGTAMYKYINGEISLDQLEDKHVLNQTVKSALLIYKFYEMVNEYVAKIEAGEIVTEAEAQELKETMSQFRNAVDKKQDDAKEAISASKQEAANREGYIATLTSYIANGLGLTPEQTGIPLPTEKPALEDTTEEPLKILAKDPVEPPVEKPAEKTEEKVEQTGESSKSENPGIFRKLINLFRRKEKNQPINKEGETPHQEIVKEPKSVTAQLIELYSNPLTRDIDKFVKALPPKDRTKAEKTIKKFIKELFINSVAELDEAAAQAMLNGFTEEEQELIKNYFDSSENEKKL